MKRSIIKPILTSGMFRSCLSGIASAAETLDRTVLPIPEPKRPTYTKLDVRKAKAPPRFEVKAPKDAPNVVVVLIDDVGFGGPSTFGGPIRKVAVEVEDVK